tara:strand:- start:29 stop:199 length:171 start_codon:yes stop_codon:yes gene_type:complete
MHSRKLKCFKLVILLAGDVDRSKLLNVSKHNYGLAEKGVNPDALYVTYAERAIFYA